MSHRSLFVAPAVLGWTRGGWCYRKRMVRIAILLCVLVACEDSSGDSGAFETTTTPAPKKANGFSAGLANDLKKEGSGSDTAKPESGSATGSDRGEGSAKPEAGSAAGSATRPEAGSAAANPGSASKPDAGSTSKPDVTPVKPPISGPPPIDTAAPRVAVKPPAEVAAIKLSLEPNWDRDIGEAATISLVVKVPNTTATRVFSFRYGYEDKKAPTDRDAYLKWLGENKILTRTLDRQRGGSWYIEGTDAAGAPVFRIVVTYGGHKLICGGSLYKDAASNQLGDIRDSVITQAKKICETISL